MTCLLSSQVAVGQISATFAPRKAISLNPLMTTETVILRQSWRRQELSALHRHPTEKKTGALLSRALRNQAWTTTSNGMQQ